MLRKRGQAAMEFLMTYGWAILVVLVVIGALAYFGVLNPQSFLPKRCQISTGLICADHVVYSGGGMLLALNNGLGNDIKVKEISFISDSGVIGCKYSSSGENMPAGKTFRFAMDQPASDDAPCTEDVMGSFVGQRIKGDIIVSYEDLQTKFPHQQPGSLLTDVEAGALDASKIEGVKTSTASGGADASADAGGDASADDGGDASV